MKRLITSLTLTTGLLLAEQAAKEANSGYRTPEGRASVAAMLGAPDRDSKQEPEKLIRSLDIKPGMTVADVGTGVGYMLPFLSKAVGPSGKVYGEDIFPDFLSQAAATIERNKLSNTSLVTGTDRNPSLPQNCCDLILILDAYHHFDYPAETLAALKKSLKPNGRLALVEYYKSRESMPNGRALQHIRFTEEELIKEVSAGGFKLLKSFPHIEKVQYVAVFASR